MLVCAGLDPRGRAGALADLWAIAQLKGSARLALTALTAQGAGFALRSTGDFLLPQLESALSAGPVGAVKLGMVPDRAALAVLRRRLWRLAVPKVVDPVTFSSKGERLSRLTPADFLGLARADCVITPNQAEAEWLGGPAALLGAGFGAVVVKGGGSGVDWLFTPGTTRVFRARALRRTPDHRGTGCRFASALACALTQGHPLPQAVQRAKRVVRRFLEELIIGSS